MYSAYELRGRVVRIIMICRSGLSVRLRNVSRCLCTTKISDRDEELIGNNWTAEDRDIYTKQWLTWLSDKSTPPDYRTEEERERYKVVTRLWYKEQKRRDTKTNAIFEHRERVKQAAVDDLPFELYELAVAEIPASIPAEIHLPRRPKHNFKFSYAKRPEFEVSDR